MPHQRTKKQVEKWLSDNVTAKMDDAGIGQPLYVAGGAIASLLLGDDPNDVDLWAFTEAMANAAAEDVREAGKVQSETRWAVTTSNGLQVIIGLFGLPHEVVEKFDFLHTRAWWSPSLGLHISPESEELARTRIAKYEHSDYPFASLIRAAKFLRRGWMVGDGEVMQIALDAWMCRDAPMVARAILGVDLALTDDVRDRLEDASTIDEIVDAIEIMRRDEGH